MAVNLAERCTVLVIFETDVESASTIELDLSPIIVLASLHARVKA